MAALHDSIATYCGDIILSRIRSSDSDFKQVFSPSIIRTGDWDWPRPDYVCFDEGLKATYALEFKPPFQTKREYLTGLGQSLAYLQKHTYSGLIVPEYADDNFRIAEFIKDTLTAPEFANVAVSLFSYCQNSFDVNIIRPIAQPRLAGVSVSKYEETKTFWAWWRDASQYEVFDLLNLSFLYNEHEGDIYTDKIYPNFWDLIINKKTKQWNGKPRNKVDSAAAKLSEKQNYKIPLVQLDLWTRDECRLTASGHELLQIGKLYGAGSSRFLDRLAYLILVNGRHLDLINMTDKFQKQEKGRISQQSAEHTMLLEDYLSRSGCIGKRKPSAKTTDAKGSYIRDEPKLWNKLGLVENNGNRLFFPSEGYRFNWERISRLLLTETAL